MRVASPPEDSAGRRMKQITVEARTEVRVASPPEDSAGRRMKQITVVTACATAATATVAKVAAAHAGRAVPFAIRWAPV